MAGAKPGRKPDSHPEDSQLVAFPELGSFVPQAAPRKLRTGRHTESMNKALAAAREHDLVDDIDDGLTAVLRAGAWALDEMEATGSQYGPSKLIGPMLEALREAHMTPDSRQLAADDAVTQLLREFADDDDSTATAPYAENAGF